MSSAKFSIAYDGPALKGGTMDVRDLAPALLAAGQLFDAANAVLNGDKASVKLSINATGEGSFEVFLEVAVNFRAQIAGLFSGEDITAALPLKELVLASGAVGLIWLVKKLKGRSPDKVEPGEGNNVKIRIGSLSIEIPLELFRLYQDIAVRDALDKLIRNPLQKEGIKRFQVRQYGETQQSVDEDEAECFLSPKVVDEILIEDTRQAAFSIISLTFKEGNKWRLFDGNAPISALIEDEKFLYKVNSNMIAFSKGDVLICEVKMTQTRGIDGLRTEYVVIRVLEHRAAARQVGFDFSVNLDDESE